MEKPGYAGTETTIQVYNDRGQLIQTATTGLADTLYTYDEIGNPIQSGLDVDGNGVLETVSADGLIRQKLEPRAGGDVREPVWSPFPRF